MTAIVIVVVVAAVIGMGMFWSFREERSKAESDRIATVRRKLELFAFLDEDWNGYEAKPISKKTISMAWNILRSMEMSGTTGGWEVFPVANGNIMFEHCSKKLDCFVEVTENSYVLECDGIERTETDICNVWKWMRRRRRFK